MPWSCGSSGSSYSSFFPWVLIIRFDISLWNLGLNTQVFGPSIWVKWICAFGGYSVGCIGGTGGKDRRGTYSIGRTTVDCTGIGIEIEGIFIFIFILRAYNDFF
jgi:hypothetical protein